MSKKPLLSEGTARRWAKYAGIQNESKALIENMYKEEALEEELEENLEEEALEETDVLAELEEMLDEEAHEGDDMDPMPDEDEEEDEEADELDVDADEAEADEAAMMSQADVEAAVKSGLEAMAKALGDALKVKIDVRAGDDEMEMDAEEEVLDEMGPEMEEGYHNGAHGDVDEAAAAGLYEDLDRDELVEAVMKRVVARLVKESKED